MSIKKEQALPVPFLVSLLFGREVILTDAAELAGKIVAQLFPLYAGFLFIVDPAANIAYVFHNITSEISCLKV